MSKHRRAAAPTPPRSLREGEPSHALCSCGTGVDAACARHIPKNYSAYRAKHRSEPLPLPKHRGKAWPWDLVSEAECSGVHFAGRCPRDTPRTYAVDSARHRSDREARL